MTNSRKTTGGPSVTNAHAAARAARGGEHEALDDVVDVRGRGPLARRRRSSAKRPARTISVMTGSSVVSPGAPDEPRPHDDGLQPAVAGLEH